MSGQVWQNWDDGREFQRQLLLNLIDVSAPGNYVNNVNANLELVNKFCYLVDMLSVDVAWMQ